MQQIENISNDAKQKLLIFLDNRESFQMDLYYSPRSSCWFFNLRYKDLEINNRKIYSGINLLAQWQRTIPFGLACFTMDNLDPYLSNDFSDSRAVLLVLTAGEVETITKYLSNKKAELESQSDHTS